MRITPRPARPGGVAIATMVSSVENMRECGRARTARRLLLGGAGGDDDLLHRAVTLTLRRSVSVLRDFHVDDAARVGVERAEFLRRARAAGAFDQEARHLFEFEILAAAEAEAVDHDALRIEVAAERGVDDVLERVETFTLAAQQHF